MTGRRQTRRLWYVVVMGAPWRLRWLDWVAQRLGCVRGSAGVPDQGWREFYFERKRDVSRLYVVAWLLWMKVSEPEREQE